MRRAEYLEISESLSIVSTVVCVHTILRDNSHQFNMGSLGAYEYAYAAINSGVNGTKRLAVARVGEPHLAPPVFADTVIATVN